MSLRGIAATHLRLSIALKQTIQKDHVSFRQHLVAYQDETGVSTAKGCSNTPSGRRG